MITVWCVSSFLNWCSELLTFLVSIENMWLINILASVNPQGWKTTYKILTLWAIGKCKLFVIWLLLHVSTHIWSVFAESLVNGLHLEIRVNGTGEQQTSKQMRERMRWERGEHDCSNRTKGLSFTTFNSSRSSLTR